MSMHKPAFIANFAATKRLHPFIKFARTTDARYFDAAGLLKTAAINEPRFSHDPVTNEALGLTIEEQRTNIALYCRDITHASWTKSNVTAVLDQTGIDGAANSSSKVTATANNGYFVQSITSASAGRSQSVYIKRLVGSGAIQLTMDSGAAWIDVTASINNSTYTRVTIPFQTLANPIFGLRFATSGDAVAVDFFQNEVGAQPTSPILTTSSAVTRTADVAFINATNIAHFLNAAEGSIVADVNFVNAPEQGVASRQVWQLLDTVTSNIVSCFWRETSNKLSALNYFGGVYRHILQGSTISAGKHCAAVAFANNNLTISSDGAAAVAGTSALMPAANVLYLGSNSGASEFLNGHLASIAYFTKALSAAQLQQLSNNG